jgi:hypothetical protein
MIQKKIYHLKWSHFSEYWKYLYGYLWYFKSDYLGTCGYQLSMFAVNESTLGLILAEFWECGLSGDSR